MSEAELWNADMDAWHLTDAERVQYLSRLHRYHSKLLDRHLRKLDQIDRVHDALAVALVLALIVGWALS